MSQIKVLHVFKTYFPDTVGGVEEAIRQIIRSSSSFDIESRIFALSPNPNPSLICIDGIKIIRSKSWLSPASCDLGGIDSFKKFNQQLDWADIVNYHFPWPYMDLLKIFSQNNKPSVLTYHSDIVKQKYLNKIYSPLLTQTLLSMDYIVATSPNYARSSQVLNKKDFSDKIKVIPLGVEDHSQKSLDNENTLQKFDLLNKKFLLSLGALRYYKGLHNLVKAAKHINALVVIAGTGKEENNLKKLAKNEGAKNIIFTGYLHEDEKIALLKNCSLFVLPSHLRSEAFGMVLVEALMFGKPLVTCDIKSGTSYVNKHNETGLVVEPNSSNALVKAITLILSNENLKAKMQKLARARYEKLFSSKEVGESYSKLYKSIFK